MVATVSACVGDADVTGQEYERARSSRRLSSKRQGLKIIVPICLSNQERCGSAVVSTSARHAGGRGSLPGPGTLLG